MKRSEEGRAEANYSLFTIHLYFIIMIERFLKQTSFTSVEDYNKNLEFIIPENFNFADDVRDAWAE